LALPWLNCKSAALNPDLASRDSGGSAENGFAPAPLQDQAPPRKKAGVKIVSSGMPYAGALGRLGSKIRPSRTWAASLGAKSGAK
jgi:hypothetical protein